MKRYIIEDNYGQDITTKVTLAVKNAEIRVIDENGTDITSKIQFKEIVIRHYEAGQRDAQTNPRTSTKPLPGRSGAFIRLGRQIPHKNPITPKKHTLCAKSYM